MYAMGRSSPTTIILISGDRDYAYTLSMLRNLQYRLVIIGHQAYSSLKSQASVFLDWGLDIVAKVTPGSQKSSPSPTLLLSPLVEISQEDIDSNEYYLVASGQESDLIKPFPPVPADYPRHNHDFTDDNVPCYAQQMPDDAELAMVALSTGTGELILESVPVLVTGQCIICSTRRRLFG
jgi:NYN domain